MSKQLSVILGFVFLVNAPLHADDAMRDLEVTIYVRRALLKDPQLGKLSLGVSTDQGEVTLSGTLPTKALADRARGIVVEVRGVLKVHNKLVIGELIGIEELLVPSSLQEDRSAPPTPEEAPGQLTSRSQSKLPQKTVAPTPRQQSAIVQLGAPIARASAKKQEKPSAEQPVAALPSLRSRLIQLQHSNPQYRSLRVFLRDGTVLIRGRISSGPALTQFAQSVSRLPEVRQVSIEDVEIGR